MKKRRMVMLVDPSATFAEIFHHGMLEHGFTLMTARTGAQAMTELARTPFDLICSAMHLPDMQGTALCATLRRDPRLSATPFFLFTSDTDRDAQQRVMPEGVTEVFHKNEIAELFNYIANFPFDDQMLSGRVLLVEDEAALAALLTRMLDSHGMQVTTCANADAAWPEFGQDLRRRRHRRRSHRADDRPAAGAARPPLRRAAWRNSHPRHDRLRGYRPAPRSVPGRHQRLHRQATARTGIHRPREQSAPGAPRHLDRADARCRLAPARSPHGNGAVAGAPVAGGAAATGAQRLPQSRRSGAAIRGAAPGDP